MANCAEAVLKYLTAQNRPYSAGDVAQNMHKEFGKTAVQKALEQLSEQGRILDKTYGKQKVYCALQDGVHVATKEAMALQMTVLDEQITTARSRLRNLEQLVTESNALFSDLDSTPTTDSAQAQLAVMEERLTRLRLKLANLTDSCVKISQKEMDDAKVEHTNNLKEFRKRKRICNDILNSILEGYPKPKKTLYEEVGIETDEDAGVNLK